MPESESTRYVTHEEFLRFEDGINRWQEDMRSEARTFQEDVRASVRQLTAEIRNASDRPTNWGWVMTGLGTVATIAALVGGLAYTAMTNRMNGTEVRLERVERGVVKVSDDVIGIRESRWSALDQRVYEKDQRETLDRRLNERKQNFLREIEFVKSIAEEADARSEENALLILGAAPNE